MSTRKSCVARPGRASGHGGGGRSRAGGGAGVVWVVVVMVVVWVKTTSSHRTAGRGQKKAPSGVAPEGVEIRWTKIRTLAARR